VKLIEKNAARQILPLKAAFFSYPSAIKVIAELIPSSLYRQAFQVFSNAIISFGIDLAS